MEKPIEKIELDSQNYSDTFGSSRHQLLQILDALDTGIFFLNPQLILDATQSKFFSDIFEPEPVSHRPFLELLENKVSEKTLEETQEYLNFMFMEEHDEATIADLNPLKKIELHLSDENGMWKASKYLSFKFKRIRADGHISYLMGMMSDITAQMEQTKRLADFEKWSKRQIQWLLSLLHIELPLLKEFVTVIEYEINHIDKLLKSTQSTGNYSGVFSKIAKACYHINSTAIILDLDFFTKEASDFKEEVDSIKDREGLSGQDFIPVVIRLGKMQKMLNEIKELLSHIKGLNNSIRTTRRFDGGLLIRLIENIIKNLTESTDKKIQLKYHKFNNMSIPFKYKQIVKEFLIVLTRFVIEFGIESSEKRKSLNVNPFATIEIESKFDKKTFVLIFRHDGNIMRIERLLQESTTAAEMPKELPPDGIDESMHPGIEVLRLFFSPDLSTTENLGTTESMEIMNDFEMVKKKLKMHGGRLKVTFTSESFCEYTVTFPYFVKKDKK
ncbi:MAG: hypothetical protein P8X42_10360 [Calditrichaceae bacterium]